jgi:hypothetical protein
MPRDGGSDNQNDLTHVEDTLKQVFPELRLEKLNKLKLSKPPKADGGKRSVFSTTYLRWRHRSLKSLEQNKIQNQILPEKVKTHGH